MFDPQVPRLLSHLFHLLVRRPLSMVTESRRHQDMIRVVTNLLKKYSIVERRDLLSVWIAHLLAEYSKPVVPYL